MKCSRCGKEFAGSGLSVPSVGEHICADCYWKIREEYDKKRNCDNCRHFREDLCEKTESKLTPVTIGINSYFVQAEECDHYTEEEIEDEQRSEEKPEKADRSVLDGLVKQLADKGQTLTYHCCHCGTPLRIGAKSTDALKTCPSCGYSLEVIDLAKLISQHLS
ncbi:hypothetical protein MUP01_00950 [Candidatus Bathyarchaeota archaeon]|nr:hypothetical protein [Candidatus Bathyarchaeota archaeon]